MKTKRAGDGYMERYRPPKELVNWAETRKQRRGARLHAGSSPSRRRWGRPLAVLSPNPTLHISPSLSRRSTVSALGCTLPVRLIGNLLAHSIRPCSEWWWHNLILILTMNVKRWRQRRREPYGPCCSWHWWWLSLAPSSMPNQPLAILGYQQVGCHYLPCCIVICRLYDYTE